MLNRYRLAVSQTELRLKFAIVVVRESDHQPGPELRPNDPAYVVRNYGGPILDVMNWGFPPLDGKGPVAPVGHLLMPFWHGAIERPDLRCLVPATQFCEYGKVRGTRGKASDHWFGVPSQPIFAFAGVWQQVLQGRVFAIMTTSPNAMLDKVNAPVMPLILHEKDHDEWLTGSGDQARALAQPYSSGLMAEEEDALDDS